jgi:patatin-like phospholipase/acyl hydrolase
MRILSIDGGGIRGLIPAVVLAEIERRTHRRIAELFDLVAGTSTGGILACALTAPSPQDPSRPRFAAAELSGLYEREGPDIFSRSLLRRVTTLDGLLEERYDDQGLVRALTTYLDETRLGEALVPVLVTAYELRRREAFFFRSERARQDPAYDFAMVDVAHATSAAPTYFEPVDVRAADGGGPWSLVDGGVFATNPAMCAYAEVIRDGPVDLVASLGTGQLTRPIDPAAARGWGELKWARPVIDVVFDGVADTVDFELSRLLDPGGYVRLQTQLTRASDDLDDASPANLTALRAEADALVAARDREIDDLCARLTA